MQEIISDPEGRGIGMVLTDHSLRDTLRTADRAYVMYARKVLIAGPPAETASGPLARHFHLGDRFRL
jgi:lipopolysaccharide export system ATP-binding protein